MKHLLIHLLLVPAIIVSAQAQILYHADMSAPGRPLAIADGKPITGILPVGLSDDSRWANVNVHYEHMVEEGMPFLQINVKAIDYGRVQLSHVLDKNPTASDYLEIRMTARSRTGQMAQVGVRDRKEPWKFHWSTTLSLRPEWKDYRFVFQLSNAHKLQAQSLYFNILNAGVVDLAKLELYQVKLDQLLQDDQVDQLSDNLLRHGRLPLGLRCGWSLDSYCSLGDDLLISPGDLREDNVSALRLQSSKDITIYSVPFNIRYGKEPYTASMEVKGRGTMKLTIQHLKTKLVRREFNLTDSESWQRITVPFNAMMLGDLYTLAIGLQGDVQVDRLMVCKGKNTPQSYIPPAPVEVVLAMPESETSVARVQFTDQPAQLRLAALGQLHKAAAIHATVTNAYNQVFELPNIVNIKKPEKSGLYEQMLDFSTAVKQRPQGPTFASAEPSFRRPNPTPRLPPRRPRRPNPPSSTPRPPLAVPGSPVPKPRLGP